MLGQAIVRESPANRLGFSGTVSEEAEVDRHDSAESSILTGAFRAALLDPGFFDKPGICCGREQGRSSGRFWWYCASCYKGAAGLTRGGEFGVALV